VPGAAAGRDADVPVASRGLHRAILSDGFTVHAVAEAPSLAWNRDDAPQDKLIRKVFRRDVRRQQHLVPTAEGFGATVRAGLGWGMFPENLAATHVADGAGMRVSDAHLDVPLYWPCWKLGSPVVQRVTDAVRSAAHELRTRVE
jgi:LysR family transcriptional regulator (chromosome initiation inhibitor)